MKMQVATKPYLMSLALLAVIAASLAGCDSKVPQSTIPSSDLSSGAMSTASAETSSTTGSTAGDAGTTTGATGSSASSTTGSSSPTTTSQSNSKLKPPTAAEAAAIDPNEIATLKTNLGTIVIRFFKDKAPITVANFIQLAKDGFYDKTKFHRVIPGFMIQGGDPNSKGTDRSIMGQGGPGYSIPAEFNDVDFKRGIVGMARSSDPNSGGSQFFIMQADGPFLNKQYTAFGQVITGLDVVDKIANLKRDGNDNPLDSNPAILEKVTLSKGDPKTFPVIPIIKS